MIRSVLTLLASLAFMVISLTSSAHAMCVDDGPRHQMSALAVGVLAPTDDAAMDMSCDGMGGLSCAFACNGIANSAAPDRLHRPFCYGPLLFFVTGAIQPDGLVPDQAERPPRV